MVERRRVQRYRLAAMGLPLASSADEHRVYSLHPTCGRQFQVCLQTALASLDDERHSLLRLVGPPGSHSKHDGEAVIMNSIQ